MLSEIAGDAQTTITSLAGGVGGVLSSVISDRIRAAVTGGFLSFSLGSAGIEFVGRAVVSATVFSGLRMLMPQTSENVFFTFLFFYCDQGLLNSGLMVSRGIVGGVSSVVSDNAKPGAGTGNVKDLSCGGSCKH